jgi:hypothetical protein
MNPVSSTPPSSVDKAGSISQIRRIDNSRTWLPFVTSLLVIFLIAVFIWFFRGGAFRLYASVFFTLYHFTGQIWISVLLIGILQNIVFLPLRFIGQYAWPAIDDFEEEMEKNKNTDEQYFVFKKKVKEGSYPFVFFIFNFVVNAIAFFSAGRIFLIDFYHYKLNPAYLYSFVPYPNYPLKGTDFYFPFFKINQTISLSWWSIAKIWIGITLLFAIIRLLWQPFKFFLGKNKQLLSVRININRILLGIGGFGLTLLVLSAFFLRHIPTSLSFTWLVADLTRQNTTMNTITAIATFITTLHAGYTKHSRDAQTARNANIPNDVVNKVFREKMRVSMKNAIILGAGAFLITNNIPCAFELSVAMFEVLYIISPYTFDRILKINSQKIKSD